MSVSKISVELFKQDGPHFKPHSEHPPAQRLKNVLAFLATSSKSSILSPKGNQSACFSTSNAKFLNRDHSSNAIIHVAMSGGVDSAVAAHILIKSGHNPKNLKPIYFKTGFDLDHIDHQQNLPSKPLIKTNCQWKKDWNDLLIICRQLSISEPQLVDLSKDYWNQVWLPCLDSWENGQTPNVDILCNRFIKFGIVAQKVFQNNPNSLLATGHYARIQYNSSLKLFQANDKLKDQSYFLSMVSPSILKRTIFPIGHLSKLEVRKIATKLGLINSNKPESMGICLVEPTLPKGHFHKFLAEHLNDNPGKILSKDGKILGNHQGLWRYTIGQRCRIPSQSFKMFVSAKDPNQNTLNVVPGYNHPDLYSQIVYCDNFFWIRPILNQTNQPIEINLLARLRKGQLELMPCKVQMVAIKNQDKKVEKTTLRVELEKPEHGVALAQVLVLQSGEEVLGGGLIDMTFRDHHHEQQQQDSRSYLGRGI
ncbi:hypothetical protein O181_090044 [Austropuccinia psidii MF-1]|uniref:tRNA-5-taurinomethyluridine 2-sulfurtransferase n=1 Tax=Austropuccinia psidii MF-1 TaxID=1389203 RepID=A0A9Q3IUU0_9BASI|nr:hypothetical protein [Austropuccinia psidii MF-1]